MYNNNKLLKQIYLYRKITSIITIGAFLLNGVFIDMAWADRYGFVSTGADTNYHNSPGQLRPLAVEERAYSKNEERQVTFETIFGKAAIEKEALRLQEMKTELDAEFGVWNESAASKNAKDVIQGMVGILKDISTIISEGEVMGHTEFIALLLKNEVLFQEFKNAVTELVSGQKRQKSRRFRIAVQHPVPTGEGPDYDNIYIDIDLTKLSKKLLSKFEEIRSRYYRLTQWDFLNRFPRAKGIFLWRGVNIEEDQEVFLELSLHDGKGEKVNFQDTFFSYIPSYAINFADETRPLVIIYVPLTSIRCASWVMGPIETELTYEPEVVVSGPGEFVDLIYLDSPSDLSRLEKLRAEYERALVATRSLLSNRDWEFINDKMEGNLMFPLGISTPLLSALNDYKKTVEILRSI